MDSRAVLSARVPLWAFFPASCSGLHWAGPPSPELGHGLHMVWTPLFLERDTRTSFPQSQSQGFTCRLSVTVPMLNSHTSGCPLECS